MPRPLLGLDCIRGFGKPPTLNGRHNASRSRPAPSTAQIARTPAPRDRVLLMPPLVTLSPRSTVPSQPEGNLIPTMSRSNSSLPAQPHLLRGCIGIL